jgi:anti-anti-sigma regulatory factor
MAESLKEQLLASVSTAETELLLDMTAVEHVDACALQVLLAFKAGLKQDKLRIDGADASIQQWIRIAGADGSFEFSDMNS